MAWPKRPTTYVEYECVQCGTQVRKTLHEAGRARFCSRRCAAAYGQRNHSISATVSVPCGGCGRMFERWRHDTGRHYCSMSCRRTTEAERKRFRTGSYQAARSANLRAIEAGVGGRLTKEDVQQMWTRQPTCVSCGKGRGLDHIIAMSRGGANTPANIQTMCRTCNVRKRHTDARIA